MLEMNLQEWVLEYYHIHVWQLCIRHVMFSAVIISCVHRLSGVNIQLDIVSTFVCILAVSIMYYFTAASTRCP